MILWLLLLESFGFNIVTKAENILNEVMNVKATNRSKVERFATIDAWSAVQAQLRDPKLLEKLRETVHRVYDDPVKPDAFQLAVKYASLRTNSVSTVTIKTLTQESLKQALSKVVRFNAAILSFHRLTGAKRVAICFKNTMLQRESKEVELI